MEVAAHEDITLGDVGGCGLARIGRLSATSGICLAKWPFAKQSLPMQPTREVRVTSPSGPVG